MGDDGVMLLLDAMARDDADLADRAQRALRRLRRGRDAVPIFRQWLTSDDAAIRSKAARILGKLGAKEAMADLARLLTDSRKSTRETAGEALHRIFDRLEREAKSKDSR